MELPLRRQGYLNVQTTRKRTMGLITSSRSDTKKVVIGDEKGVLTCFSATGDSNVHIDWTSSEGEPIARLETVPAKQGVFITQGANISGFSKKGKKFFQFDTNLTEPIRALHLYGAHLFVISDYLYNHYVDCIDTNYFILSDRLQDLTALQLKLGYNATDINPILASRDRFLRVVEDSEVLYEVQLGDSASAITPSLHVPGGESSLIYGCSNGVVGQVLLNADAAAGGWKIKNELGSGKKQLAAVTALCAHDISGDGVRDVIVGRDDGTIDVYGVDIVDNDDSPRLCFSHNLLESVTNVVGGRVAHPAYEEIVASSYSGQVISFTSQQKVEVAGNLGSLLGIKKKNRLSSEKSEVEIIQSKHEIDGQKESTNTKEAMYIQSLRVNINELKEQVSEAKERMRPATETIPITFVDEKENSDGSDIYRHGKNAADHSPEESTRDVTGNMHENILLPLDIDAFPLNDNFELKLEDASYTLTIELQVPIDIIILQSSVPIDVLDTPNSTFVISRMQADSRSGNFLLTSYRSQTETNRLVVNLRTIEGHYGTVRAYVTPRMEPQQCRVREYDVKPLSLHHRVRDIDTERAMNTVTIKGDFSATQMHNWVRMCMLDVPDRMHTDHGHLQFRSTFLNTVLECDYQEGIGIFRSDNISTISILKDALSREATANHVSLHISYSLDDDSVIQALYLIHPKLETQLLLEKRVQLVASLRELQLQDKDISYLSSEYIDILENADTIEREFKQQPKHLERLYGIVTDLFIDKNKFKGVNAKHRVPALLNLLDNYNYEQLQIFFIGDSEETSS